MEKEKHIHGPNCEHEHEDHSQTAEDHVHGPNCNHKFHSNTIERTDVKIGRNDPCHCGSGQKYKKCCGK